MSAASASVPGPEAVFSWVADAVRAPSMHNAQPWLFRYDRMQGVLTLLLDASRTMPRTDPTARGLHIGCGAALFNLRVAAARAGREARVSVRPAGFAPELLAAVTFAPAREDAGGQTAALADLHPAIARRHTSRAPFSDEPVPGELLDRLGEAARAEGGALDVADDWRGHTLTDLVWDAEQEEKLSPEARAEIAHWTSERARDAPEGIPAYARGPRRRGGRALVREFPGAEAVTGTGGGAAPAVFEWSPCLAVLGTRRDEPADWVRAGQAMERVLLRATLDGLSTSLNSQALEHPDLRRLLRDPLTGAAYPQMLVRLGYGPEAPATPRRPVSEVLVVD